MRINTLYNAANKLGRSVLGSALLFCVCASALAEKHRENTHEWHYLGGDSEHTRYNTSDQIDAANFTDLEEAWVWDGASFQCPERTFYAFLHKRRSLYCRWTSATCGRDRSKIR